MIYVRVYLTELYDGENEQERIRKNECRQATNADWNKTTSTWKRVNRFFISKAKQDSYTNKTNKMKKENNSSSEQQESERESKWVEGKLFVYFLTAMHLEEWATAKWSNIFIPYTFCLHFWCNFLLWNQKINKLMKKYGEKHSKGERESENEKIVWSNSNAWGGRRRQFESRILLQTTGTGMRGEFSSLYIPSCSVLLLRPSTIIKI